MRNMNDIKGPGELNFETNNLAEAWTKWKRAMGYYLIATCKEKSEEEKVAIFMCTIGRQGQDIKETFELGEDGEEIVTVKILFQKFEEYCQPRKNLIVERHRFLTRNQGPSETIDQYLTELKTLATTCEWGQLKDDLICSRIVSGILSTRVRERLLREPDLTLKRAINMCQAEELSKEQLKFFDNNAEIDAFKEEREESGQRRQSRTWEGRYSMAQSQTENSRWKTCTNCGNKHARDKCPAFGRQCNKCKKLNHYAKMCRSSGKIDIVESRSQDPGDYFFLDSLQTVVGETKVKNQTEYATVMVNDTDVKFKLDTGAEVNVLTVDTFKNIASKSKISLRKPVVNLIAYNGKPVPVKAVCILQCKYRGDVHDLEFYISETPSEPVLSVGACKLLNLVKFTQEVKSERMDRRPHTQQIQDEFHDLFTGLGCLNRPYNMKLDPEVEPVIHPPRKIPHRLRSQLEDTLNDMVKQGVVERVDGPTDWVNSMVVVKKKDGSLRICIDPKDLNKALKREHYQLPTIEEITARMAGARYFSTLDARSGYWQIPLDEDSSKLTTFNTPFGRFRFTRMPFGIRSAQEVFHKRMHQIFEDLEGVETDIDDILVWGKTRQEHDDRLRATLQRAREQNLRFNAAKCKFGETRVVYIGHTLTGEGVEPDASKIEAIVDMPEPQDKKGIQRLLGMVNYVAKFAPNVSEKTAPLRELLKKDVVWHWNENHRKAFEEIKKLLTTTTPGVLRYYDVTKPVIIQVDASKSGLGAALIQSNMPVAYVSRSLTDTEKRYAQIEKELLAVVFGCNRFRQYIYGQPFIVESDHQPLEAIMKKSLDKAPARLQRMLLSLQDYDVVVKHKPGKELYVADTLSRAHLPSHLEEDVLDLEHHVNSVISSLPVSDNKLAEIRTEMQKDPAMRVLMKTINDGWPSHKQNLSCSVRQFWSYRDELWTSDGVVFKCDKILIPPSLRKDVLRKIHQGHMGIERSKQRARELVFWPGINQDIETTVTKCSTCAEYKCNNQKEPMIAHEIPQYPWQIVATDLFVWNGDDYLLVVDYYSRFWEVAKLPNTKSATIIGKIKVFFARHGIPETVKSDNGPQYSSREFTQFANEWGFSHVTSSPTYPQSNGLAERTVRTVKSTLEKARRDKQDPNLAFLEHRNTPIDDIGSPAQMCMGRRLRSRIPSTTDQLRPRTLDPQNVQRRLERKQSSQKKYYDRSSKPLADLSEGESIRVQQQGKWEPGIVSSKAETPRSYNVMTRNGAEYRRNRRHLRKSEGEEPLESLVDGYGQSVSVRGMESCSDSSRNADVSQEHNSAREESALSGDVPHCAFEGQNIEFENEPRDEPIMMTRSGRIIRKPLKYKDYV